MFKSIVVAVDGSSQSLRALSIGAELAVHYQALLGLVYVVDSNHMAVSEDLVRMAEVEHVIQPSVANIPSNIENLPLGVIKTMSETAAESQRVFYQVAEHIVERAKRDAKEAGVKNINALVEIGNPGERIVAYAKRQNADLIVIGRRGFGPLKSLLLGSTSNKVSQLAECSVMTIS